MKLLDMFGYILSTNDELSELCKHNLSKPQTAQQTCHQLVGLQQNLQANPEAYDNLDFTTV